MNVKLGNEVINNINTVQLEDADNVGSFVDFKAEGGGVQLPAINKLRIYYDWVNNHFIDGGFTVYTYPTDTLGYSNTEPTRLKSVTVNVPAGESKSGYVDMDYISYSSKYFMIAIQNDTENTSSSIPILFCGSANSIVSLPSELKDYGVGRDTSTMNDKAYRLYTIYNPASGWARNKCFNEFSSVTDTSLAIYIKGETID